MTFQTLRYFVAVAETLHFGRAAALCHVSQPTLSSQLARLEDTLGVPLFERTNKRVTLTAIGAELLGPARRALSEVQQIESVARASRDPLAGPLRLGILPTLAPYLMPLLLEPLARACPHMPLILEENLTDRLLDQLRHHQLDCALLATSETGPELTELALFDEPLLAALPTTHPLAGQQAIPQAALAGELLVLAEGHCLAAQALAACSSPRRRPVTPLQAGLHAATLETLVHLVAAGYGVTLVPALAAPSLAVRPLALRPLTQPVARTIRLVSRPGFARPQALRQLERILKAVVAPLLSPFCAVENTPVNS